MPELEHGTPEGWAAGCRKDTDCPATHTHGMSCTTAHIRNASGEHRYLRARAQGLTPPQIARAIGIAPAKALHDTHALAAADERFTIRTERRYAAPAPAKPRPTPKETPDMNTPAPTPADIAKTTKPLTVQPVPDIDVDELENPAPAPKPPRRSPRPPEYTTDKWTAGLTPFQQKAVFREIREWCNANGHEIPSHGKIPQAALAAYHHAHPGPPQRITYTTDKWTAGLTPFQKRAALRAIREWCNTNGHPVPTKGNIPQAALAAYDAAHPETPAATPDAAQPLAESANDSAPQEDTGDPAIETEAQAEGMPATEDEAMGHPADPYEILAGVMAPIAAEYEKALDQALEALPADEFAEALDQTRERVAEIFDLPASIIAHQPVTDAYYAPRPEWADVAVAEDVEKARNIAVRLEQENARLLEQLTTAHNALTIVLTKHDSDRRTWTEERIQLLALAETRLARINELETLWYPTVQGWQHDIHEITRERDQAEAIRDVAIAQERIAREALDRLRGRVEDAALTPRWLRRKVRP